MPGDDVVSDEVRVDQYTYPSQRLIFERQKDSAHTPMRRAQAIPRVMNQGDARHWSPYGRLWSTLGMRMMARVDSEDMPKMMGPTNISSTIPQPEKRRLSGSRAPRYSERVSQANGGHHRLSVGGSDNEHVKLFPGILAAVTLYARVGSEQT
jgi:hypothetical protein